MKELFTPNQVTTTTTAPVTEAFSLRPFRENWMFISALVGFSMWLVTNQNEMHNANSFQDVQIQSTVEDIAQANADIEQNSKNIQTLNNTQVTNYNDIVLKLTALQSAVEELKSD